MSEKIHEPEVLDDQDEQQLPEQALVPRPPSELAELVSTAKQYPRSLSRFRKEAESLACLDPETAEECLYALPRGGKTLEGPSVRFAEIVAYSYGNLRVDVPPVEEGEEIVTATATCFDLERNTAIRITASRSIVGRNGRYQRDMINVTSNAAVSVALRNSIFRVVPKPIWEPVYKQARLTSLGDAKSLGKVRQAALDYFLKQGVHKTKVFAALGVDGIEDIKEDQIVTLRGMVSLVKSGEATIEQLFDPEYNLTQAQEKADEINEALDDDDAKQEISCAESFELKYPES